MMHLPKRAISNEEALDILEQADYGVLSTVSATGEPYGVPINYVYLPQENCVIFHCARVGKKLDNIAANPQVSLAVVGQEKVIPDRFTTHYESVIVSGTAALVNDAAEKIDKLRILSERFSPNHPRRDAVIEKAMPAVAICKIAINEITGKRNRDL